MSGFFSRDTPTRNLASSAVITLGINSRIIFSFFAQHCLGEDRIVYNVITRILNTFVGNLKFIVVHKRTYSLNLVENTHQQSVNGVDTNYRATFKISKRVGGILAARVV